MDYTKDPDGGPGGASTNDPDNEHPNNHDYTQLVSICNHTDSTSTATLEPPASRRGAEGRENWGRLVRCGGGGRVQIYELGLGGEKKITHVFWADPEPDRQGREH